jgi:ubiquinone/menaquinone biosynthesis C-methylase UbiE
MNLLKHYATLVYYTFNRFKPGQYERMQSYFADVTVEELRIFSDLRTAKVLDVGGGSGVFCKVLEERNPGWDVTNLEPSRDHIGFLWHKTVHAGGEDMPFPDNHFDLLMCRGVIEHIPYGVKEQVLKEMYRVLKPGGVCHIMTQPWWNPNAGHHLKPFHVLPFPIARFLRQLIFRNKINGSSYAQEHLHPATFRRMRKMIEDAGLRYERGLDTHLKLHFMTKIPVLREILVPSVAFISRKPA